MPLFAGFGTLVMVLDFFKIIFLSDSDMHLSDFLCAFLINVIFRVSRINKKFSN